MLSVSNLSVQFGKRILFDEVNTTFTQGNCYGIIGANGAGKSTFLKIIAGDIDPTSGHVHLEPGKRMSVLNQNHNMFDENTVLEAVMMGNKHLFAIKKEMDDIYLKPDFSDKGNDNEIRKIGESIKKLKVGSRLPAIALIDTTNKPFNISKDITKETVIFFWTGCARAHIEHVYEKVNTLKEKHPNINFIAVNVDNDTEWKNTMGKYKFNDALELRSTNFDELREKWVITKINRTIILTANGTIKNAFTNLLDEDFESSL